MFIARISGDNVRVHGKAQGYLGLPVRHIVLNEKVNGPGTPAMETAWTPTPQELEDLNNGGNVIVRILGTMPPPMLLYTNQSDGDQRRSIPLLEWRDIGGMGYSGSLNGVDYAHIFRIDADTYLCNNIEYASLDDAKKAAQTNHENYITMALIRL